MGFETNGEINEFIRNMPKDWEEEFCLNSRRWIQFMALELEKPPKTCPFQQEGFLKCEQCRYCELKKPTKYFFKKRGF